MILIWLLWEKNFELYCLAELAIKFQKSEDSKLEVAKVVF